MALMDAASITAELQRKKNLGIKPTNQANVSQYNSLKPQTSGSNMTAGGYDKKILADSLGIKNKVDTTTNATSFTPNQTAPKLNQGQLDYFGKNYGGIDKYAADQNAKYASGDNAMKAKVLADAMRVGYSVKGTPGTQNAPAQPSEPKTYTAMDYVTAMNQSKQQLDPLYKTAVENVYAEQHKNSLNADELASARGGSHSGLAADLQNKVGIAGQSAIKDLDAKRAAQTAEMAQALVNRSEDVAFRNRSQDFNEWLGVEQLGLSKEQVALLSKNANLNAAIAVGDATGKVIKPQEDWNGLYRQADNSNTPLNIKGQQWQSNEQQIASGLVTEQQVRDLATRNAALQEWQLTGTATPAVADALGVPVGTPTSDQSYRKATLDLETDKFKYTQLTDAAKGQANTAQTVTAATAGDMLTQALQKVVGVDAYGEQKYGVYSDPATREEAFVNMINTTGIRGKDVVTALTKAGYAIKEINALQKEYPEVFQ